jgi:ribokinase
MSKVLVVGSYNVGLTVFGQQIPKIHQTVMGDHFDMGPGGKGSNQAIALARLGADVTFLAQIGNDIFGKAAMELFNREGIDTSYIKIDPSTHTGAGIIFVNKDKHNCIAVAPGANYNLSPETIDSASELFKECDYLLVQLETPMPTVYYAIEKAKLNNMKVILNPAPAQKIDDEHLAMIDIITPNETEAQLITGIEVTNPQTAFKASHTLINKGVKTVIITLGSQGCVLATDGYEKHFDAYKVKPVDTTGAGDAFNGGLGCALAEGKTIEQAIDFASKVGAISVTSIGCVPGLPNKKDLSNFIEG